MDLRNLKIGIGAVLATIGFLLLPLVLRNVLFLFGPSSSYSSGWQ